MIRTLLATAVMISAIALAVPEAQACLSCEYKPEVLSASEHSPRVQKRVRVDAVVKARKSRASKEHVASRKSSGKRPVQAEKAPSNDETTIKSSEEKTTNATTEAATPRAQSVYNTLLKTTEPVKATEPAEATGAATPPATAPAVTVNEPPAVGTKPVATAQSAPATAASEETSEAEPTAASTSETVTVSHQKGDKTTGCKKFFPMADITLTVDCK